MTDTEIIKNLVPKEKYGIKCPYPMEAEFFVIHNTANDASAAREIEYMISNDLEVSYHYAVDDCRIVQGLPESRNGWHAGDGVGGIGNRRGIGIEICYSLSGGERFERAEALCARFVAEKLREHGWGIDRVRKHEDFDKKYCPHRTLDMGWQRFLKMISSHLFEAGRLSGNDRPRGEDEMVLYFKGLSGNKKTGTNKWGWEVAIDKGGVALEDPHYSGNTPIPEGGKVLSGHGRAGEWIRDNVKAGYHLWFDTHAHVTRGNHHSIDHFNGIREADELVIYDKGEKAATNVWGWEAAVNAKGHVVKKRYGGKTDIPPGGFVLSGHGRAASWINRAISVGDRVKILGNVVKIG